MESSNDVEGVTEAWCKLLPKIELHAHLSGSISKTTLHRIWARKQSVGQCLDLHDPRLALADMPDINTFFGVFSGYIYKLVNDEESIVEAVHDVLDDFEIDGVVYVELRTTPRSMPAAGIAPADYVEIVLRAIDSWQGQRLKAHLILSVDRSMTASEAYQVFEIGSTHFQSLNEGEEGARIVAIDLCGNPMKGDVSIFDETFQAAKTYGIPRVIHFAEVPASSTDKELDTILSWEPHRLGHVICESAKYKQIIEERQIALELCLSCNTIAKMIPGGMAEHHFGYWKDKSNDIALSTDDVGVFESPLSNEVFQAAKHFDLSTFDCVKLQQSAARAACRDNGLLNRLIQDFWSPCHRTQA